MTIKSNTFRTAVLTTVLCVQGAAANLIQNGGFESGLSAWSTLDQAGSDGSFLLQTGSASPTNGLPVSPPPEGEFAAMTDAGAGGTHILYQDFVVPSGAMAATISFSLLWNNLASAFHTPDHLDWARTGPPDEILNQRARVDILTTSADPFSIAAGDVLLNLFETAVGSPLTSGYNDYTADLTGLMQSRQGQTLRLRFAEVDNVSLLNFGVDNVRLETGAVPEPGTWALVLGGLGAAFILRQR